MADRYFCECAHQWQPASNKDSETAVLVRSPERFGRGFDAIVLEQRDADGRRHSFDQFGCGLCRSHALLFLRFRPWRRILHRMNDSQAGCRFMYAVLESARFLERIMMAVLVQRILIGVVSALLWIASISRRSRKTSGDWALIWGLPAGRSTAPFSHSDSTSITTLTGTSRSGR